jgi:arginyl-tRNA synthetase
MLKHGMSCWAPVVTIGKVVTNFSFLNVAKEMNVNHLRSTIIGDNIAYMLEYFNVIILQCNHVGDSGTQV